MRAFFLIMTKTTNDVKRALNDHDWVIITALYIRGVNPAEIVKQKEFAKTNITVRKIKERMRKDGITWRKNGIDEEVKNRICEEVIDEKVAFTKKVLTLYDDSLKVIENIIQNYKDEAMLNPTKPRATAYNMDQLAGALNKCQNGIRTALGMDKDGNLTETEPETLVIEGLDLDKI